MNPGAENFLSIKIGQFFFTKYMANDDFSEPPQRADSKNPIFFFCQFLGLGHLRGPVVSVGRILGVLSIEPFLGGGSGRRALSTPPPPGKRKPGLPSFLALPSRGAKRGEAWEPREG